MNGAYLFKFFHLYSLLFIRSLSCNGRMYSWVNILEWRIVGWISSLHKGHLYFLLIFLVLMWQILDWLYWKIAQTYKPLLLITLTNYQNMGLNTLVVIFSVSFVQLFRCCLLQRLMNIHVFLYVPYGYGTFWRGFSFLSFNITWSKAKSVLYLMCSFVPGDNGSFMFKIVPSAPKRRTNL